MATNMMPSLTQAPVGIDSAEIDDSMMDGPDLEIMIENPDDVENLSPIQQES